MCGYQGIRFATTRHATQVESISSRPISIIVSCAPLSNSNNFNVRFLFQCRLRYLVSMFIMTCIPLKTDEVDHGASGGNKHDINRSIFPTTMFPIPTHTHFSTRGCRRPHPHTQHTPAHTHTTGNNHSPTHTLMHGARPPNNTLCARLA